MPGTQKINTLFIALVLLIGLSACGGSSTPPPPVVSTDATLSGLTASAGTISPVFTSGTTSYTLTTSNVSTTVTPTINQANATVTVNGISTASGAASASIALAVGDTVISILVTAEDVSTTQTYTVTISRLPLLSTDATLSGLTVSAGAISPVFASGTTSYTLTTSNISTTVTPTVNEANATVTVNGTAVASGSASASIALAVGDTVISILVTAEDVSTTQTYTVTVTISSGVASRELIDPTPGFNDRFGTFVVELPNGNIVVSDPNDSSITTNNGAVHLYSPFSSTPIASIYGNDSGDRLGFNSITALGNNNYVIASSGDTEGGIAGAGSVRLVDGSTGVQIGATLAGDVEFDGLGYDSITALGNNNYVIASGNDDEGGIIDAGSVRLMNGSTGVQIGATLAGDVMDDQLGYGSITALGNNNYVIASRNDDEGGVIDAGSVRLVNGSTGLQIGATLAGDVEDDQLGRSVAIGSGITPLGNNNYVIASQFDDEGSVVDAGSVRLLNGSTGAQIGVTLTGDVMFDGLGGSSITALGNNNYVIVSSSDTEGGIDNAGSVRLVNGSTGVPIGVTLSGDMAYDGLGAGGITVLGNNNYVIASYDDDEGGIVNAGSVRLVNGSTGVPIGAALAGDVENDRLGDNSSSGSGVTALDNNNYVIASGSDDEGGIVDAGSVRLMNGSAGVQIGATLAGDVVGDGLGSSGITALDNNNYVIASQWDDEGGVIDSGSVRLVNGSTAVPIGDIQVAGMSDRLGTSVTALGNNNFAIVTSFDDQNGIVDAGSLRLVNGSTGLGFSEINGAAKYDWLFFDLIKPVSGDYYILSLPRADNGAQVDSGMVRVCSLIGFGC